MSSLKEAVVQMVQSLPENCTLEDIYYHLYVQEKVLRGLQDLEDGNIASEDEADARIEQWLCSNGPKTP